ncbi:Lipase [Macleaya cordata]|uniref:Lipase n=1 Tax=Macleaya cordata TaxID=56857 RepID=A0A200QV20_MACCD|nr:Lipase [Macleaya cordata]
MERRSVSESVGMSDVITTKACSLAKAARTSSSFFLVKNPNSSSAIFAFPGSWSIDHWYSQSSFGASKIDTTLFPSLRSIGNNETAIVNGSFLQQFTEILRISKLREKVNKAVGENKQIVFTGHSSGGAIAVLATIWQLEQLRKQKSHNQITPLCVTFGSPLVGDRVFGHALRREDWSRHFVHFIMKDDIVPRILLAPLSSIQRELQAILPFFDPKVKNSRRESMGRSSEALGIFKTVLKNTLSVTSHAACLLKGCTNLLFEAVSNFIELSPYRPFGTYIFCAGNGKLFTVKNPDAILQLLFHCLQLNPEQEVTEMAYRCLQEHLVYENQLRESMQMQDVVYLDELSLSSEAADSDERRLMEIAMNDLGLSTKARICLHAAGEFEKKKLRNQGKIDANISKIEEALKFVHGYREKCEVSEMGYYDAFKLQREVTDFEANIKRLELAGIWDEIIEMLKRYELPDGFENRKEWVELGTKFRRLVEPLDIANYYRHSKGNNLRTYMMIGGRPKRYRYTQRWLEHADQVKTGSWSESCFLAEVEELCILAGKGKAFEEMEEKVLEIEREVQRWVTCRVLQRDVFLEETTFVKWWRTLPKQHKSRSCIARLMNGEGKNLPPIN